MLQPVCLLLLRFTAIVTATRSEAADVVVKRSEPPKVLTCYAAPFAPAVRAVLMKELREARLSGARDILLFYK